MPTQIPCCIYEKPTGYIKIENVENATERWSEYILKKLDLTLPKICPLICTEQHSALDIAFPPTLDPLLVWVLFPLRRNQGTNSPSMEDNRYLPP